jgi:hypothetical protein
MNHMTLAKDTQLKVRDLMIWFESRRLAAISASVGWVPIYNQTNLTHISSSDSTFDVDASGKRVGRVADWVDEDVGQNDNNISYTEERVEIACS